MSGKIEISRELAERIADWYDGSYGGRIINEMGELRVLLAAPVVERQPVAWIVTDMNGDSYFAYDKQTPNDKPLYASPPAPVSADIAHDRAYRNGMMAGFQFGISGNEKGYALAIANFNSEIRAAKGKAPAPVSVVLPERKPQMISDSYARGWNDCINMTKELNQ